MGVGLTLPSRLVENIAADRTHGDERRAWLAQLPRVIEELATRWSLVVESPFQPGGAVSWVAPARTAAGGLVVLKVGWLHDEAIHEAAGLRVWDSNGTVRLQAEVASGSTSALLLECCEPGIPLSGTTPPDEQDRVVATTLRRLWVQPPIEHPFRPLETMCLQWATSFEGRYEVARTCGATLLDPGVVRDGIDLFRQLPSTAEQVTLLCTDLHAGNILAAAREPWLVIDPKPHVGDPTYDPLQHMLNCPDRLATDPLAFAKRMAALVDLDPKRLRLWLFARCVVQSLSCPELARAAVRLAP